jgi:hypothetical protein
VAALKYICLLNDRKLVCLCGERFFGLPFFILLYSSNKILNFWFDRGYFHYLSMTDYKLSLCQCVISHMIVSWDFNNLFWQQGILGFPDLFWSCFDNSVIHSTNVYWPPMCKLYVRFRNIKMKKTYHNLKELSVTVTVFHPVKK